MLATLLPLHEMMARGANTLREVGFQQTVGQQLVEAYDFLRRYQSTRVVHCLSQAWDIYYGVFRRINKQLPELNRLELQYVSPALLGAHDLELAVPGTYSADRPAVRIRGFSPTLQVRGGGDTAGRRARVTHCVAVRR
jgi:FKBP12-rapamycin complex-associated protein